MPRWAWNKSPADVKVRYFELNVSPAYSGLAQQTGLLARRLRIVVRARRALRTAGSADGYHRRRS